ncbi:MAG: cache domain-containing protein [Bacillota bacterium]|nr:cache domain-containing protein [Bacillota bacterium]
MVTYKKNDFLGYMSEVQKCKNSISMLNDQWENIKLQCEINCPNQSKSLLPMMTNIQNNFIDLQQKLIDTLVTEALNKMSQKIISKAQVAIDILIRNLYERTADVGFLATDDDIRSFVSFKERSKSDEEYIIKRLQEYVAKYSVYEEIVILDKSYKVIANLDQSNEIKGKILYNETLEKTLYSNESFIETFDESPLQPDKKKSHIFSRKIFAENSEEVVGILCLCFRFENEMKQIFKNLSTDYDGSVIMIVDNDNIVIASNDENQVPVGIKVELVENSNSGIVYYRGLAYIAKTVKTQGYQDYYGLGWRGHIMIPIHLAFRDKSDLSEIDSEITAGLMNEADSFSGALNEIIDKTQEINNTLKRIVYNGQILSKDDNGNDEYSKLKCILDKIGKIGISTSHLFRKSVQNLFATVVSTSLVDAGFTASLCINIMDRKSL